MKTMSVHVSAKKIYKSLDHVRSMVDSRRKSQLEYERKALEHKDKLFVMGANLYNQFRDFVAKNKGLYEEGFMQYENPSITDVQNSVAKQAVKVFIKYDGGYGRAIILIPYLFIKDPNAYKGTRMKKAKFGNKTSEQIEQHYDGEIARLLKEVENLKTERNHFTLTPEDWK